MASNKKLKSTKVEKTLTEQGECCANDSSNTYENDGSFLETFKKEIFKQRMENYERQWATNVITPKTVADDTKPEVEPAEAKGKEPEVPYYTTQTMYYKEGGSECDGSKSTKTPYQVTYLLKLC